jgi:hypothetical protein
MPRQPGHQRKVSLILATIFAIAALAIAGSWAFRSLTGLATLTTVDVTITGKTEGRILLGYSGNIEMGNAEYIDAEFENVGTETVSTAIDIRIYQYVNGSLKQVARYFDTTAVLDPGYRKAYQTVFFPPVEGVYYIRARAPYGAKVAETWVSFNAYFPYVPPEIIYVPTGPAPMPSPTTTTIPLAVAARLEYPSSVSVVRGGSTMFNISVVNIGQAPINNVRLLVSTTTNFNFSISPRVWPKIHPNNTRSFMISIDAPLDIHEASYFFDFDMISAETTASGSTSVEVVPPTTVTDVCGQIANYEFMVMKTGNDITSAFYDGYDVTLANSSIMLSKSSLALAKQYCLASNYDAAKFEMGVVRTSLEDAALQLASSSIYVVSAPAYQPWYIAAIIAAIAILIVALVYWRRKKEEEKPQMLRSGESEGSGSESGRGQ